MLQNIYLNFIGGCWKEGGSGQWDTNRNPAHPDRILGRSTRSTLADVDQAIAAAEKAQKAWARTPRPSRGAILSRAAQHLREQAEHLAETITQEEGKNLTEARAEVLKSIHSLEFNASESRRSVGQVIPSDSNQTLLFTSRMPLGVVGIITPWNFPLCIPAWKIGPALLEGNSVVFKPASLTPASAVEFVRCLEKAGLPAGVLNLVLGSGSLIGKAIVQDPRIRGISFTGSNEVGTELNAEAAKRLAKVQLEMGGKNPIIVLADANLDQAVEAAVQGAFGSTGQRCTATSRLIVEQPVHDPLVEKLLKAVKRIPVGDGLSDPNAMGPLVDEKALHSVLSWIEKGKKEGAELLCGGERVGRSSPDSGYFVAPTVFDRVTPEMSLAQKEIFGPVLSIITVQSASEAIRIANAVEYGLSSSIYTQNISQMMEYIDLIETGILHVNAPTLGGEVQAPFGGIKATGTGGREMGTTGPEFFSEIKAVYINYQTQG